MKNTMKPLAVLAFSVAIALPAIALAGSDYSSVNKSISVEANSSAGEVDSVNGSIRIGNRAVVTSIESVNGTVNVDEDAKVERHVEVVNGTINLAEGVEVGGTIASVNGSIRTRNAAIAGDVHTVNGGIALLDGSIVEGNVKVRKPQGWSSNKSKPVKVTIGEDVQVFGDLIFEQPVELHIHASARVGEVIGKDITIMDS
ncbi:MAG: polymer-forming cytoskeletal protein [Pseudomonadota bacterium]